jgi:DNA-binding beta-propeller fold protein YncE
VRRLQQASFPALIALVVIASFVYLVARGRPAARFGAVQPLLAVTGLTQPRGLAFSPDGTLLVAEGGSAAPAEAPSPGRVTALSPGGGRLVVADGLPAAATQALFQQSGPSTLVRGPSGGDTASFLFMGPSGEDLYGTVTRLLPADPQWRVDPLGSLSDRLGVQTPAPATPWGGSISGDGVVYVTLPFANQLVRLRAQNPAGAPPIDGALVTGFIDSGQRNPLPTGVAVGDDGALYVTLFGAEPYRPGTGRVVRVQPDGKWQPLYDSLTFPIALAFAPDGQLYVLEFASGYDARTGRFTPNSGRLLAVGPAASRRRTVTAVVNYPTALRFSPTGDAYLTENGVFSRPGEGRVLRVTEQALRTVR